MAGSLNHITAADGAFTMDLIENLGDAHEALLECHQIIAWLLSAAHNDVAARGLLDAACVAVRAARSEAVPKLVDV